MIVLIILIIIVFINLLLYWLSVERLKNVLIKGMLLFLVIKVKVKI